MRTLTSLLWPAAVVIGITLITTTAARTPPRPPIPTLNRDAINDLADTVARVDAELTRLWKAAGIDPAPMADELTVLRRLSLALHGTIPSLEEIRLFEADPRPDRLQHWTAALLEDERFADYFSERLARAYVGVDQGQFLIFRRDRFKDWLATQLSGHRRYDEIVRDMIAGEGVWTGQGEVNFITAGFANKEIDVNMLTARTVRAFLGQRIDCAQCHDHPFDDWKQRDFEGLAAYYAQAQLTLAGIVDQSHGLFAIPPDLETTLVEGPVSPQLRTLFGRNRRGMAEGATLSLSGNDHWLVVEPLATLDRSTTGEAEKEVDGEASARRIRYVIRPAEGGYEACLRKGEYFVQDRETLEDRLVAPRVPFHPEWLGTTGTRRERLAAWITHPQNRRFERATANRVWGLLFGRPFAAGRPVDDLPDPDSDADLSLLDLLGEDFRRHGCDLRRLVQVIAASAAFRLSSQHPRDVDSADPIAGERAGREAELERICDHWGVFPLVALRPEQVIGAMIQANHLRAVDQNSHLFVRFLRFVRERDFVNEFGDPGADELEERNATIPQALLRMNGQFARELTEVNPLFAPGRIHMSASTPERLLETVYLVCLTRRPNTAEREYFVEELTSLGTGKDRNAVVQDLYWTLFNSPEFSWNH